MGVGVGLVHGLVDVGAGSARGNRGVEGWKLEIEWGASASGDAGAVVWLQMFAARKSWRAHCKDYRGSNASLRYCKIRVLMHLVVFGVSLLQYRYQYYR